MLLVKIQATSNQAKILERRIANKEIFCWMGASQFETIQLIRTTNANLCHPLKVVMIEEYTWQNDHEVLDFDEVKVPPGFEPIHIFIAGEYSFSTTSFETKKEALVYYRADEKYKGKKLTARVNNHYFTRLNIKTKLEK